MATAKLFSKEELGKKLIPEKIFKFAYKREIEAIYQKLYYDNPHPLKFANLFFISCFLSFTIFTIFFEKIYSISFINGFFYTFFGKLFILPVIFLIFNLLSYYMIIFAYFFYHQTKFKKAEEDIEKDLPEFLDNLVSNLKGGIPLEKALLKSVRPEQTALLREVTNINQQIMMGDTVFKALHTFRKRFESQIIGRTFLLIEEGIKNGGNIAAPLQRISENLKKIYNLNNEIKANSGGFAMVINAITMGIAPLLFSLAITILTFIADLFSKVLSGENQYLSIKPVPTEYGEYLMFFSYSMIIMITFFASLITAELKNEKLHNSIKYLPIMIGSAILIFMAISEVLLNFFKDII